MTTIDWGEIHLEWGEEHQVKSLLHLPTGVKIEGPWEVTADTDRSFLLPILDEEVGKLHVKDAGGWRKRDGH